MAALKYVVGQKKFESESNKLFQQRESSLSRGPDYHFGNNRECGYFRGTCASAWQLFCATSTLLYSISLLIHDK